jgi:hypothetical protein
VAEGGERPADGRGTDPGAESGFLADGCSGSPRFGSASIEQPTPVPVPPEALAEMEAEAFHDVAQIAKLHQERLPDASTLKPLLDELATSLSQDAARLRLVSSVGSDQAAASS